MSSKVCGFAKRKRGLECMIVACLHVLLYQSLGSHQATTRLALLLREFNKDADSLYTIIVLSSPLESKTNLGSIPVPQFTSHVIFEQVT